MERLQVPPIRTPLAESNGSPASTAKEWYLHWQKSGERVNDHADSIAELDTAVEEITSDLEELTKDLDGIIRHGTHAQRLAMAPVLTDALWVETDRQNIVYQAQKVAGASAWVYVTGAMRGTILSADQRPTDLGANDTGLVFLSTDSRSVRWNGSNWVALDYVSSNAVTGAPGLTHANVVPKVGAAGAIVEGGITDESAAGSNSLHITPSGDVGIGMAGGYRLDVAGDCNVSGVYRVDGVPISTGGGGGHAIQDEGLALASRPTLNFTGAGVTASDDSINNRTVVTITGGSGGGGGTVDSVFGRTGAVVAAIADYTASQVIHAVDQTLTYANPTWLTSLAWSKITDAPSASGIQTPWLGSVDAAGYSLVNSGLVQVKTSIEMGQGAGATGDRICYIDMVGDDTYPDFGLRIFRNAGPNGGSLLYSRGTGGFYLIAQDAAPIQLYTSNLERVRITPDGNVGIGTENPLSRLAIVGLPTSAAGLASGDIWRDPAVGNVLKIVP